MSQASLDFTAPVAPSASPLARHASWLGMTAREKFTVGERVVPSALGIERLWSRWKTIPLAGRVHGFGRASDTLVLVKRDGIVSPESYHMDFWDVDRVWARNNGQVVK